MNVCSQMCLSAVVFKSPLSITHLINKDDYITDCNTLKKHITECNTLLEDNSAYHKTTTDMMETHLKEAENLLDNITIANKQHVSKLLPTQPKQGIFYALNGLHKLQRLISTKYNLCHLNKVLMNTELITQVANGVLDKTTVQINGFMQRNINRKHLRIC